MSHLISQERKEIELINLANMLLEVEARTVLLHVQRAHCKVKQFTNIADCMYYDLVQASNPSKFPIEQTKGFCVI
jgi:hypothetical protein